MLVFEVRKVAESTYKRMRNPAKVYLIDTGLCRRITSTDTGRSLENIIGLELKRRGYEIFYFEDKRECDFIVKTENGELLPIQATFELNEANEEREIGGLIDACKHLGGTH
jgi:predicted AAA+ superfamily ATPase